MLLVAKLYWQKLRVMGRVSMPLWRGIRFANSCCGSGATSSCGCSRFDVIYTRDDYIYAQKPHYKKLRMLLGSMKARCHIKTNHDYQGYGAKGVSVCDLWRRNTRAFYEWAMSNGYRPGLLIDRIENSGGYCPDNCRFVDARQSAQQDQ